MIVQARIRNLVLVTFLGVCLSGVGVAAALIGAGTIDLFKNVVFREDAGAAPSDMVRADLNADGHADLIITNSFSNDISIFLGKGDGTFGAQARYPVGREPQGAAAADLNGDQVQDVIVINAGSSDLSILPGRGDGTFGSEQRFPWIASPTSIAVGDFNHDLRPDLVISCRSSQTVILLLNDGAGGFTQQSVVSPGLHPSSLFVRDLDGDGLDDLIVVNAGEPRHLDPFGNPTTPIRGVVAVFLGMSDGSFAPPGSYPVGVQAQSSATGDFNGDGKLDLAVADLEDGDISLLPGLGAGQFGPRLTVGGFLYFARVALVDLNHDGFSELIVVDPNGLAGVSLGHGNGTFDPPNFAPLSRVPIAIIAEDFDGDGEIDLASANLNSNDLTVAPGLGDGTFGPRTRVSIGQFKRSSAIGDLNGDHLSDLVVVDERASRVGIALGRGAGSFEPVTFTPKSSTLAGKECHGVRLTILDRDALDSPALGIEVAAALVHFYSKEFDIDKMNSLLANDVELAKLKRGEDPKRIVAGWHDSLRFFRKLRHKYLLYPELR